MKIAVVVTGGLHPSGREQVVPSWLALFEELSRAHEIHAFALRHLADARSYPLRGFTVHDLGRPSAPFGLTRLAQEQALHRALSIHGPFDLVHGLWGDPAGQFAVSMGRTFAMPSVVTFDSGEFVALPDIDYGSQRTTRGRAAVAEACHATRTHVCSQFMAAKGAAFGVRPAVIPLTTVTGPAPARSVTKDSSTLRLIQVASLSKVKNQAMLVDALRIIRQSVDAHLDLVGEDTLGGALRQQVERLGVAGHVTFHGFVPQDRLPALYGAADIYVQSSLHEAAGVSVLEAAAAGVPVVGTRQGHVADWSPVGAKAIDNVTAEALAAAVLAAHSNPEGARAMAARGRDFALRHDAASAARQMERLYRESTGRDAIGGPAITPMW